MLPVVYTLPHNVHSYVTAQYADLVLLDDGITKIISAFMIVASLSNKKTVRFADQL